MANRVKDIVTTIVFIAFVGIMFILCLAMPKNSMSESERRPLATFPDITFKGVVNASVMGDFSKYASDQIPFRDEFRGIKGVINNYVLLRGDNNGFYKHGDFIAKNSESINEKNIGNVASILNAVYNKVLKDGSHNITVAVIPDKNNYIYEESGHRGYDFDKLEALFKDKLVFKEIAGTVDVEALLEIGDYYYTDTHWRQEKILDVAKALVESFGKEYITGGFKTEKLEGFKGVYAGQSALPCKYEDLYYLTNETLVGSKAKLLADMRASIADGKPVIEGVYEEKEVYFLDEFKGLDPYNVFLGGPQGIIVIENPANTSGKELFLFRDSFGSSLAPLLVESYSKITVLDLRNFNTALLTQGLVDFTEGSDVLFIFSALALNEDGTFNRAILNA